ncbi:uncharacterized protein PgNI_00525 [Pyricularia grisea]|uniref:Uncharacterized protein n=1 Tax=Pyricularia grisea TaxID=148305 RepID=A0A6P8BHE9_PYRGI|nr:uncharacterized protein PgNI_00525 [Pyricularia grisea]TLD16077.1 hypothetical protein PgNI_00525 [Pyricularia grisea]
MVSALRTLLAIAACLGLAAAQDKPNKPEINPKMDVKKLIDGLEKHLKTPRFEVKPWKDQGWIPERCRDFDKGLKAEDYTTFYAQYEDCDEPWVFCRHKDSKVSDRDLVYLFGKMPVEARSMVRHVIGVPKRDGVGWAGLWTGPGSDIIFVDKPGITVVAHEVGHALDYMAMPDKSDHKKLQPFSDTPAWKDNVKKDSALPTSYANNGFPDNFAEMVVVAVYDNNVPEKAKGLLNNAADAIKNQLSEMNKALDKKFLAYKTGSKCLKRIPPSKAVNKKSKRKRDIDMNGNLVPRSNDSVIQIESALEKRTEHRCSFH